MGTLTVRRQVPPPQVEIASPEEMRAAIKAALDELGLTLDDLRRQAESGRFQSERARLTWLVIRDLRSEE
jgi:hypothetical protein